MRYPTAVDRKRIGKYPALSNAGGGFVWDDVLEYRVWCCPARGADDLADGDDYYYAFATYPEARAFARHTKGAESPVALIRQKEYIDEPTPGKYKHVRRVRITEWPIEFLNRPRRNHKTIPRFFSPYAPENRLAILRGLEGTRTRRRSRRKR